MKNKSNNTIKMYDDVDWQKLTYTAVANQDLESQDSETTKGQLSIVRAKLDSLSSSFYEKI